MNRNRLIALNAIVVSATTVVNMVLSFVETRMFLQYYGTEINGLIQSGNQILNYIILFEGGLCSAYMYHMYQSIAESNRVSLSSYYAGFKKSIQQVVLRMLGVAILISAIYPLVIKKGNLSYIFVFSVFSLLAAKVIIPYQVTLVPKQMIILKEKKYVSELISGVTTAVIYVAEILVLKHTHFPVQILLLLCVLISFSSGMVYQLLMKRFYKDEISGAVHPNYTPNKMSKDVMAHTISGLIFGSTDNVILSILASLNEVTIYSNYMMLIRNSGALINKLLDGATATLGIKIARNDTNSYEIFKELLSSAMFLGTIITSSYVVLINDFIRLWVGKEYCVGYIDIVLFAIILFCNIILAALQPLVSAGGKFKESKRFTIIQAIANLIITIILVPFCGLTGALLGTALARVFISVPCNYRIINKYIFPEKQLSWNDIICTSMITIALSVFGVFINNRFLDGLYQNLNWIVFFAKASAIILSILLVSFVFFYLIDGSFKKLVNRILKLLVQKKS